MREALTGALWCMAAVCLVGLRHEEAIGNHVGALLQSASALLFVTIAWCRTRRSGGND